jgi:hypothetical protein
LAAVGVTETETSSDSGETGTGEADTGATVAGPSAARRRHVARLNPDDLAALEEERGFLSRSLTDLDREHEVGDVGDDDYATLQADYRERLARVTREIESGKIELASAPRRSRRSKVLIVAGVVVFALLCGVTVGQLAGRRETGQSVTGEITKTARERNTECLSEASAKPSEAVACYDEVLKEAPQNVEALTYRGWIKFTLRDPAGLNDLLNAVKIDGSYPDVHAFLAIVLYQTGCAADAKAELDVLDTLNPSPLIQQQISGLRDDVTRQLTAPSSTASTCPVGP